MNNKHSSQNRLACSGGLSFFATLACGLCLSAGLLGCGDSGGNDVDAGLDAEVD